MKMFYITNVRIPSKKASGIQIMQMCEAFGNQGVEVELIIPRLINPANEDPFAYYGVARKFKITKLPPFNLARFGGIWIKIQLLSFAICAFFYAVFNKVDVIISRNEALSFFLNLINQNLFFKGHSNNWNRFSKLALTKCRGIVVVAKGIKDLYVENEIPEEKIIVAPNAVDINKFDICSSRDEARAKLGLPRDKKIILHAGHLYDWKGVHTLAQGAQFLEKNELVVFVGGSERDVARFKKKYGYSLNILILGHRLHEEIPLYLKAADVLILCNSGKSDRSRYYTSPLKLFEYMASGTPVIASDLPSIREVLNDNNAALVEPDNPEALAQGIAKVLNNQELANRVAENAFNCVRGITWDARADTLINFIRVMKNQSSN